jgi:glutamyl-Q tRNA(Asp) synthetase
VTFTTRFAPSPTGPLHLGHAYSAILAHDMARAAKGRFLLRIEDIDETRARPEWETQIYDDLHWLGLSWETPVWRQSDHMTDYARVIDHLLDQGLLYPCTCNRRDIQAALSAPQEGITAFGPDGPIYPGTCRGMSQMPETLQDAALRLDILLARTQITEPLEFLETGHRPQGDTGRIRFDHEDLTHTLGDIVLARRDMGTSYHLSVVLDDAAQGVTHVVRGADLFDATRIHVVLQKLLGLPTPAYHHHRLIRDETGKRLAKRDDARAISKYRADGATPDDIRAMVGLPTQV